MSERLYFRQLLAGRDFAREDATARQMVNFAYVFGDRESGEALVVDPAYAPVELAQIVEADGMRVGGVVATHYHADHVGGNLMGHHVDGIAELLEYVDVPVHVHKNEVDWITRGTGVDATSLVGHEGGDVLHVGELAVSLVHTPGHTPGSQCLLLENRFMTGDTLFLEGCGRTDLPGSDPEEMYRTLALRLGNIRDESMVYPGHQYSPEESDSMGHVRERNYVLAPTTPEQWLAMFGR